MALLSAITTNHAIVNGLSCSVQLHTKISWLLSCPLGYTAHSFQILLSQPFHSLTLPKVHSQPSLVLAREATACVTVFCCHRPALISMPRKKPALCDLSAALLQVAPGGGTRSSTRMRSLRFSASRTAQTAMKNCSQCRHTHG